MYISMTSAAYSIEGKFEYMAAIPAIKNASETPSKENKDMISSLEEVSDRLVMFTGSEIPSLRPFNLE